MTTDQYVRLRENVMSYARLLGQVGRGQIFRERDEPEQETLLSQQEIQYTEAQMDLMVRRFGIGLFTAIREGNQERISDMLDYVKYAQEKMLGLEDNIGKIRVQKIAEAKEAFLRLTTIIASTTLFGGGKYASMGATLGNLAGTAFLSKMGKSAGPVGALLGGFIGSWLDKDSPRSALPPNTDALKQNTLATNENTRAIRELASQLINVPTTYTPPVSITAGGGVGASGGGIVVQVIGSGDPDSVAKKVIEKINAANNLTCRTTTDRFSGIRG